MLQPEIFEAKIKDILHSGVQLHRGQRERVPAKLQLYLLNMVAVNMHITKRVNEFTRDHIANLRDHHGEKRIGGDIKRHSKENISTPLIELA
jgi:hypothetical protein